MWSVLMGNFELTRILWRKSVVPLRTAVMARRLCLKLRDTCAVSYSAELASAADHFELWAMGCLDSISDSEDAVVRPPRPPPIPLHLHPSVPSLVPIGPAGPACAHLSAPAHTCSHLPAPAHTCSHLPAPAHTCSHLLPSLLTARACSCLPVYVLRISSLVYRCEGRTALAPTPSTAVPPKCGQVRRLPMSPHLPWPSLTFHGLRSPSMAFAHLPWPSLTFHSLLSFSMTFSHLPCPLSPSVAFSHLPCPLSPSVAFSHLPCPLSPSVARERPRRGGVGAVPLPPLHLAPPLPARHRPLPRWPVPPIRRVRAPRDWGPHAVRSDACAYAPGKCTAMESLGDAWHALLTLLPLVPRGSHSSASICPTCATCTRPSSTRCIRMLRTSSPPPPARGSKSCSGAPAHRTRPLSPQPEPHSVAARPTPRAQVAI